MNVVKALVTGGVTICATIHSPSPYTFDLFDRLLVLVRGETVYFGPNGDRMLDYFKNVGVAPPKTALNDAVIGNNADYLTDLVVGADREGRAGEYADAYSKSSLREEMAGVIARCAKVRCCAARACAFSTCWACQR
jgi:ATP-binding cassette, subfamily G (WHITE), member 2